MDVVIFFCVAAAFLIASLWLSFVLGRRKNKIALGAIGGLWAAFTAALFFGMNQASGWDQLGYFIFLLGVSAPVGVGGLTGTLIGWARSDTAKYEKPSTGPRDIDTATIAR